MGDAVTSLDELLRRNRAYQQSHAPQPMLLEIMTKGIALSPFIVVGCIDPRANPTDYLGLKPGDCAIIRNCGGRANQSVVNDILVLDSLRGISDVVIVHHTDCGMTHCTNDMIRGIVKSRLPPSNQEIDSLDFGAIKDGGAGLEQSVKDDMKWLSESPYLASKKTPIKFHGFIYDIKTGELQKVQL